MLVFIKMNYINIKIINKIYKFIMKYIKNFSDLRNTRDKIRL